MICFAPSSDCTLNRVPRSSGIFPIDCAVSCLYKSKVREGKVGGIGHWMFSVIEKGREREAFKKKTKLQIDSAMLIDIESNAEMPAQGVHPQPRN